MKIKESLILFITLASVFILVLTAATSCNIAGEGGYDILTDKEDGGTAEAEDKHEEEPAYKEEISSVNLWTSDLVPEFIGTEIKYELGKFFDRVEAVRSKEDSDVWIEIDQGRNDLKITWVLAPVVSFFKNFEHISYEEIKKFWYGDKEVLNYLSADGSAPRLILTENIFKVLEEILGENRNDNIRVVSEQDLPSNIEEDGVFSIVPFDSINKKYKVLDLDGTLVLDKDTDISSYPLAISINVESKDIKYKETIVKNLSDILITNRDTEELVSVIMTGVTAIVRQVARKIERDGVLSPGTEIAEVLKNADITHISNELPFVEGCTGTNPQGLVFCSSPEYIELLEYVGTDVIELTGNHMNDYGNKWMYYTLDMYDEEGWPYFGGGRNLEESYKPAVFEIGSNKIAFLGANTYGPASNWATKDTPGSARINVWGEVEKEEDMEKYESIIKELKEDGYIVIFTFQYEETYNFTPTVNQVADFRRIIDAGADIVSGSQSHYPMGVEFRGNGFINYGLGNLFFGQQSDIMGNNPGIIAKHIFYKGEHINTILITTMLNEFSQPRLTTSEERVELIDSIFGGSIR